MRVIGNLKVLPFPSLLATNLIEKKKTQTEVEPAPETEKPENSAETNIEEPSKEQTDISAKAVSSNRIRVRKKVRIRQS